MKEIILKSTFIQLIGGMGQFFIRFLGTMILARLLTPNDFGVFAIILLIFSLLSQFKLLNATQIILSKAFITNKILNNYFFLNFIINIIIFFILILFSDLIAKFYNIKDLSMMIKLLSIIFIFQIFYTVSYVLLERNMKFKIIILVQIISIFIEIGISILLVIYFNFNYLALLFGLIGGEFVKLILFLKFKPWIPKFDINFKIIYFLIKHGFSLMFENVFIFLRQNIDYLIISKVYSPSILGLYSFAYKIPNIVSARIAGPISGVINPSMSQVNNINEIIDLFIKFTKLIILITFPIMSFIFLTSKSLIIIFWGDKWIQAAWIMKILVWAIFFQIIAMPIGSIFIKIQKTKELMIISGIKLILSLMILLCFNYFFGFNGLVYGMLVSSFFAYIISLIFIKKIIHNFSFYKYFKNLFVLIFINVLIIGIISFIFLLFSINQYLEVFFVFPIIVFLFIFFLMIFKKEWNEFKTLLKILLRKE